MKSKKGLVTGIIIGAVILLIGIGAVVLRMGLFKSFDAQGYVKATLDQNFKGEVKELATMVDGKSEKELMKQYEEGVEVFVTKNIATGIEMDKELEAKYIKLCEKIFASMKYDVKEAEKLEKGLYEVPVEFQSTDVFAQYMKLVKEESEHLVEKVEKGEFQGTVEEINAQMQEEYLNNAYELLEKAQKEAKYGEKKTMKFTVKQDENGLYMMDDAQIYEFILKIMGLDAIQD